jgi:hypothetical protein
MTTRVRPSEVESGVSGASRLPLHVYVCRFGVHSDVNIIHNIQVHSNTHYFQHHFAGAPYGTST